MIKINKLEIENVKRVKAVKIKPTANGLTIVGGKNNQGKTSVLDSIAWALGGNTFKPSNPTRDGSVLPPTIHITMSNGLVVERKGKNSDLKVIDPSGQKGGQQLLNEFVEQLALDLPKFMQSTSKEKAQTLLQIIGVGDKLYELEQTEKELYNKRHAIGQIADQKKKFAAEQPHYTDAPDEPISASELIKEQQEILARNGENQRKRDNVELLKGKRDQAEQKIQSITNRIANLREQIAALEDERQEARTILQGLVDSIEVGTKTLEQLHDESTAELENSIANIEEINVKVRANLDKEKAEADAQVYTDQYDMLTGDIEAIRRAKIKLLDGADLPLPGLSVVEGELTYNGFKWDNMSGSDQLKVAAAIIRRLNPKCGFVLIDKLEQMDLDTLREFGYWLEQEGLQAIATRVSTGDECSIIIEDGYAETIAQYHAVDIGDQNPKWKAGEF